MSAESFTVGCGADTLRGVLLSAPPVYDPGGPICFIEDWRGDIPLLAEAELEAAVQGAVLTRVVCRRADSGWAALLTRRGYAIASEWYTITLPLRRQAPAHEIRRLTTADVPRVLELGEQKRRQYEAYSPVFWRPSPLPRETFAPYIRARVENPETVALAHDRDGVLDGFVLANAQGYIDDFMVATPALWTTGGADLLSAAGAAAHARGTPSLLVVCGQGDRPMREMLVASGLDHVRDWYIRSLR